jgi:hypothetical protein
VAVTSQSAGQLFEGYNLGPPDGKQRIDDILNIVHQYRHDCA